MAQYLFNCETDGEITLELKMSEIKEEMECPICKGNLKRIYSPISDVWKCQGAFGKSK